MTRRRLICSTLMALAVITTSEASAADAQYYARPGSAAPFSPAVRAGDLIFSSGQIGATRDGKIPETMEEQAKLAMDNLRDAFAFAEVGMDDVVKCTVMLADMKQWAAFNSVYVTYFKPGRLPARSALGASGLAFNAGVEIECIAYQPHEKK